MKNRDISRRDILKALTIVSGGAGLAWLQHIIKVYANQALDPKIYLPFVKQSKSTAVSPTSTAIMTATPTEITTPSPTSSVSQTPVTGSSLGKVVHIQSSNATFWTGEDQYWNYVDQQVVDQIVNLGVMKLTGTHTVENAWRELIPGYVSGQKVAIKVSFNNTFECDSTSPNIDSVIEPVNSVVKGLEQIGVSRSDIWVYDAIRALPDRFVSKGVLGVSYFDGSWKGVCRNRAEFASNDPQAYILFSPPNEIPFPPVEKLTDVLINASYLINMPIMKRHAVGVSLGFKNHFGSINNPGGLHDYIGLGGKYYRTDYNPLLDVYKNSHIEKKTVLTIGDGLFAAKMYAWPPSEWATFGNNVPNSLFFSTDPVAIDCVMHDFIAAEIDDLSSEANRYLRLAGQAGLGIFEQGDPWGNGYSQINYLKIAL